MTYRLTLCLYCYILFTYICDVLVKHCEWVLIVEINVQMNQTMLNSWEYIAGKWRTIHHRKYVFTAGSLVELPLFYFLTNMTDSDSMFSPVNVCAVSRNRRINDTQFGGIKVLYIDSTQSHPGYARLNNQDGKFQLHTESSGHGPAKLILIGHLEQKQEEGFEPRKEWRG